MQSLTGLEIFFDFTRNNIVLNFTTHGSIDCLNLTMQVKNSNNKLGAKTRSASNDDNLTIPPVTMKLITTFTAEIV